MPPGFRVIAAMTQLQQSLEINWTRLFRVRYDPRVYKSLGLGLRFLSHTVPHYPPSPPPPPTPLPPPLRRNANDKPYDLLYTSLMGTEKLIQGINKHVVFHGIALCVIVLHCIELHCIALYCIPLHCIVLYCIVLH